MKSNDTLITEFCERQMIISPYFQNYIQNCPSFLLLQLERSKLDPYCIKEITKIHFLLSLQQKRNQFFRREIQDLFDHTPVRIVGLKGYFLYLSYYPEENIRFFHDLDTFVKVRNGYQAYRYIKKNGYQLIDYQIKNYNKKLQVILFRRLYFIHLQHLEFVKKINGSKHCMKQELHFNFNLNCGVSFPLDEMMDRAMLVHKDGLSFYTLDPVDHLLYLMFHTISHLSYTSEVLNELQINLQNLYDVAQLLDYEAVDWDEFIERGLAYHLSPFISLFYHIFNAVIPDKVPGKVFKALHADSVKGNFRWHKIYLDVIEKPSSELIIGDYWDMPIIKIAYETAENASQQIHGQSVHDIWHNAVNQYERKGADYDPNCSTNCEVL